MDSRNITSSESPTENQNESQESPTDNQNESQESPNENQEKSQESQNENQNESQESPTENQEVIHETPSIPQEPHRLNEQTSVALEPESDSESQSEDPAAGTGLNQNEESKPESPKKDSIPSTTAEFKKLFQELGISADGLRGKKAFKDRYDQYLKEKENDEETEDISDDELEKDISNFVEIDFEGVEYLEDEDTSNIYNASHQLVAKWNVDGDDFIWESETFKTVHDTMKD